jgi:hypothetical protein
LPSLNIPWSVGLLAMGYAPACGMDCALAEILAAKCMRWRKRQQVTRKPCHLLNFL